MIRSIFLNAVTLSSVRSLRVLSENGGRSDFSAQECVSDSLISVKKNASEWQSVDFNHRMVKSLTACFYQITALGKVYKATELL